jgi:hypothetical protein
MTPEQHAQRILRRHPTDNALLVCMETRARCAGSCGRWLKPGDLAWTYIPSGRPVDGNYVECSRCRYGEVQS